jgi:polyisoprenoid-binding protein YceI
MHTEPALSATSTPQLGHYDVDPSRSAVTFRTRHLFGLAPVRGTFATRATARIDRTEYGVTAMRGLAGRYLDVTVQVQCVRR